MRAERNSLRIPRYFANSSEHCSVFFRQRISHGVRQIQDRCARIYRHTAHLAQKIDVRSPSILGGELHFAHMLPAVANHRADGFERLLPGHVQLHTKVQIGGCEEDMEARRGRRFQSFYCGAYIFLLGACECRNRHRPNFLRYLLNRFQVARDAIGKPASITSTFSAQAAALGESSPRCSCENPGDCFAITERCVKDAYEVHGVPHALVTHGRHLRSNLSLFYF